MSGYGIDRNGNTGVPEKNDLTGSNVGLTTIQLLNAQTITPTSGFPIFFDLSKAKNAQIWIAIDKNYDLTFYPTLAQNDNNLPSSGTQQLATNFASPGAGRSVVYQLTALPSPAGKLLITNKDAGLAATVSVWLVTRNN